MDLSERRTPTLETPALKWRSYMAPLVISNTDPSRGTARNSGTHRSLKKMATSVCRSLAHEEEVIGSGQVLSSYVFGTTGAMGLSHEGPKESARAEREW